MRPIVKHPSSVNTKRFPHPLFLSTAFLELRKDCIRPRTQLFKFCSLSPSFSSQLQRTSVLSLTWSSVMSTLVKDPTMPPVLGPLWMERGDPHIPLLWSWKEGKGSSSHPSCSFSISRGTEGGGPRTSDRFQNSFLKNLCSTPIWIHSCSVLLGR